MRLRLHLEILPLDALPTNRGEANDSATSRKIALFGNGEHELSPQTGGADDSRFHLSTQVPDSCAAHILHMGHPAPWAPNG